MTKFALNVDKPENFGQRHYPRGVSAPDYVDKVRYSNCDENVNIFYQYFQSFYKQFNVNDDNDNDCRSIIDKIDFKTPINIFNSVMMMNSNLKSDDHI